MERKIKVGDVYQMKNDSLVIVGIVASVEAYSDDTIYFEGWEIKVGKKTGKFCDFLLATHKFSEDVLLISQEEGGTV
jgi:hypothetical protein